MKKAIGRCFKKPEDTANCLRHLICIVLCLVQPDRSSWARSAGAGGGRQQRHIFCSSQKLGTEGWLEMSWRLPVKEDLGWICTNGQRSQVESLHSVIAPGFPPTDVPSPLPWWWDCWRLWRGRHMVLPTYPAPHHRIQLPPSGVKPHLYSHWGYGGLFSFMGPGSGEEDNGYKGEKKIPLNSFIVIFKKTKPTKKTPPKHPKIPNQQLQNPQPNNAPPQPWSQAVS